MIDSFHVDKTTKIRKKRASQSSLSPSEVSHQDYVDEMTNREEILEAGQDNQKKGREAVAEQEKDKQAQQDQERDDALNRLDMKVRFRESYKRNLAQVLANLLGELDWPSLWTADVVPTQDGAINIKGKPFATQDGVLLVVCAPDGRVFHKGMLVLQEPALDYAKVYDLALQTENLLDQERGLLLDGREDDNSGILDSNGKPITRQSPTSANSRPAA